MDLEQLRSQMHQLKINPSQQNEIDLLALTMLQKMRQTDNRHTQLLQGILYAYAGFMVIYIGLFIYLLTEGISKYEKWGWICYITGFLYFSYVILNYLKRYKNIKYNDTSYHHLKKLTERYRLYQPRALLTLPFLVLVNAGSVLIRVEDDLGDYFRSDEFMYIQFFFWGIVLLSFVAAYVIWRKKSFPVYKSARTLLKTMEE